MPWWLEYYFIVLLKWSFFKGYIAMLNFGAYVFHQKKVGVGVESRFFEWFCLELEQPGNLKRLAEIMVIPKGLPSSNSNIGP